MEKINVAALMCCHNRVKITLKCINSLFSQKSSRNIAIDLFLVDDGSSDGTGTIVKRKYPNVNIIQGNGKLFWNRGMRLAWERAIKPKYDYYLWINDDVELNLSAINILIETSEEVFSEFSQPGLVVGGMVDPRTGSQTYGGLVRNKGIFKLKFYHLPISIKKQKCDTINGNCVLIPKNIAYTVGNLSPYYTHSLGDYDYGLRVSAVGFTCWVAPGTIGYCSRNSNKNTWYDSELPLKKRKNLMHNPKGRPLKEWVRFVSKHGGRLAGFVAWLNIYFRLISPD